MKNIAIIVSIFALSIGLTSCGKADAASDVKCYDKVLNRYNTQKNEWEAFSFVMECDVGSAVCYYDITGGFIHCVED